MAGGDHRPGEGVVTMPAARSDLFNWQARRAAEELERRREALPAEIQRLRPHAHRRIRLEERLRQITEEALKLEAEGR